MNQKLLVWNSRKMSKSFGSIEKQPLLDVTALCGLTKLLMISIVHIPFSSCNVNERASEPEIPRFHFFYVNEPSNQCLISNSKMFDRERHLTKLLFLWHWRKSQIKYINSLEKV